MDIVMGFDGVGVDYGSSVGAEVGNRPEFDGSQVAEGQDGASGFELPAHEFEETSEDLLAELQAMRGKGHPVGWYRGAARDRFREINFKLNRLQTVAPVFREMLSVPKGAPEFSARPEAEQDLIRDLQVIDLDWIHQMGVRLEIDQPLYKYLLSADDFNLGEAEAFAKQNWGLGAKLELLVGLPELVRCQLCCLMADDRREFMRRLKNGRVSEGEGDNRRKGGVLQHREKITQELKRTHKHRLVRHVDDWLKLWMVCKMLDQWTATSDVVTLYSLARGKKIKADTVRASLRKVKEYLPFGNC